jgi:uncharacterized protein
MKDEPLQGKELVALGALLERSRLAGQLGLSFEGKRDMYETLGYSKVLTFAQYAAEYARGDIAGRIIDLPASYTWREAPEFSDGADAETETPFLVGVQELVDRLHVWHYLERVDRLAGIGRFGVLLIGARDNQALSVPLKAHSLKTTTDILYLSAFAEGSVTILTYERDPQSVRFGLPDTYQIQMGSAALGFGSEVVHWSRLLHVAEDLTEDEVFGRPRLERVFNRLQDLMKIVGGGAEAAWRVMDRGLHADVREGFKLDDPDAVSDEIENYLHGLQRFIRTQGMTVTPLGADMVDPSGLFGIEISLIAAAANIPQRFLIGSAAGALASAAEDAKQLAGDIKARRTWFAEPMMLRPFLDRLVWTGALPAPTGGNYDVIWHPLFELNELEHAQIAGTYASAIAAYAPSGTAADVVPLKEFRAEYLKLSPEPNEKYLPSKDEQAKLDAAQAAKEAAAVAATVAQPEPPAKGTDASAQPETQPEQAAPEPATNEADLLAAVAAEYSRAADILRTVVVNYDASQPRESEVANAEPAES